MKVITVPGTLDERSFDQLAQALAAAAGERVLIDARHLRWVDPAGMLGLLAAGAYVQHTRGEAAVLQVPESPEILSYLTRMRFFEHAAPVYEIHNPPRRSSEPPPSDILLEVTRIESHADIHTVVDVVNARAMAILSKQLHYPLREAGQFSVVLSEACQNIVEHAESTGWVATQTYNRMPGLDRRIVKIALVDLGIGFKGSLSSMLAAKYGTQWDDGRALEAAFMHGLTRFHDPGRGQGLKQIRKNVGRWDGRISIRSGTARISQVPSWDDTLPLEEDLPYFPGTQIAMVLPAREQSAAEPPATPSQARRAARAAQRPQ